jgi:hypothetical protein
MPLCGIKLCYVGPCQDGMACPPVVDGGDDLRKWRVAANLLNWSRAAGKG